MIGHALTVRPTPETRAVWDRWIGLGFAIGSSAQIALFAAPVLVLLSFFVGPFPGVINLVGAKADAIIFFVGSIFFTVAALLEVREGTLRICELDGLKPGPVPASLSRRLRTSQYNSTGRQDCRFVHQLAEHVIRG